MSPLFLLNGVIVPTPKKSRQNTVISAEYQTRLGLGAECYTDVNVALAVSSSAYFWFRCVLPCVGIGSGVTLIKVTCTASSFLEMILGMSPTNEIWCCIVTTSLIGSGSVAALRVAQFFLQQQLFTTFL